MDFLDLVEGGSEGQRLQVPDALKANASGLWSLRVVRLGMVGTTTLSLHGAPHPGCKALRQNPRSATKPGFVARFCNETS
jgi:hypothetical protein